MKNKTTSFYILPISEDSSSLSIKDEERTFYVNADFFAGGVWSGIKNIAEQAFTELSQLGEDELLEKYSYELFMVLPHLRANIQLKHACLTDLSSGDERTRNYPADRADRIAHGIVGLIQAWKALTNADQHWHIVVSNFEKVQHLAGFCFLEMARRLYQYHVYVTVNSLPNEEHTLKKHKVYAVPENTLWVSEPTNLAENTEQARNQHSPTDLNSLEESLSNYNDDWEQRYLVLRRHYHVKQNTLSIARIAMRSLFYYNHRGYYHEAAIDIEHILNHFNDIIEPGDTCRMTLVDHLYQTMIATNQAEQALALLDQLALPELTDPHLLVQAYYHRAMLNIRFLPKKNILQAEHNIKSAMKYLQKAQPTISQESYALFKVFLNNGLALIRVKQNRPFDAIQLCGQGFTELTEALGENTHKLHRSVLLYNTAQVYASLERFDDAIEYYRAAINMDPHYSEYYNELGNLYQKLGHFEQAKREYKTAIRYSAPYPEVYFNLAVCETNLQQYLDAIKSFSVSESLAPNQPDLFMLRAELYDEMGNKGDAIVDYTQAIALDSDNDIAYANRASIFFECGQLQQAKLDIDCALSLDPNNEMYLENREAVICEIESAQAEPFKDVLQGNSVYQ